MLYRVYKIRMAGDTRDWDRIEPVFFPCREDQHLAVMMFLMAIPGVDEVRWNERGSLQGHYARPLSSGLATIIQQVD